MFNFVDSFINVLNVSFWFCSYKIKPNSFWNYFDISIKNLFNILPSCCKKTYFLHNFQRKLFLSGGASSNIWICSRKSFISFLYSDKVMMKQVSLLKNSFSKKSFSKTGAWEQLPKTSCSKTGAWKQLLEPVSEIRIARISCSKKDWRMLKNNCSRK